MVIIQRAMMKMVVMMMMTIWTDRSPICALFPGVLRGLLTDYQWEGVDPRHPNTSNNSSTTFTLSTSTPHRGHIATSVRTYYSDVEMFKRQPHQYHNQDMLQLLLLGKVEYGGGPIFKVILEC